MTRLRDSGDGPKRGRGRPKRIPLPPGVLYEDWRAVHMPPLELLLAEFKRQGAELASYERHWKAYQRDRDAGLRVEEPDPPESCWLWLLIRATAFVPAGERAELVEMMRNRRRPAPWSSRTRTITTHDVMEWLRGEALAHGIASGLATPVQAWFVIAELLLCDDDIGTIAARVAGAADDDEIDDLNARLASAERNRVNKKRKAFGYRTP